MTPEGLRIAADVVVLLALAGATLSALGMARMPDLYNQVHAAGVQPFLGLLPLALVQFVHADFFLGAKAVLVVLFLLVTTAVSSHVIALAAYSRETKGRESRPEDDAS